MTPDTERTSEVRELIPLRAQADRRRVRGLLPWMHQSVLGYSLAAEKAQGAEFADYATAVCANRRRWVGLLEDALAGRARDVVANIVGGVHRAWMRAVASAGDGGLIDELERGDASLERKIRRALRGGLRADDSARRLEEFLLAIRAAVAADRDSLVRRRAGLP